MPAQAGIQGLSDLGKSMNWIPAGVYPTMRNVALAQVGTKPRGGNDV